MDLILSVLPLLRARSSWLDTPIPTSAAIGILLAGGAIYLANQNYGRESRES